jgi:ubiquitin-like 1-activating enzyme E1 B
MLRKRKKGNQGIEFDKDEEDCLDFVTSAANIRSFIFDINRQTRFQVKAMAGNIIPAIATTNAIIAGLVVMEALKVLEGRSKDCKTVQQTPLECCGSFAYTI